MFIKNFRFMITNMKTILALFIIIAAILGIYDAGYITYEKINGVIPPCKPGFACATVLESPWAYIGPIPLSVYGLAYYFSMLTLAVMYFMQFDIRKITQKLLPEKDQKLITLIRKMTTREWMMAFSTFGFLFSLYLLSLMAFVIQAWCYYCLISAFACISLFILNLLLWFVEAKTK